MGFQEQFEQYRLKVERFLANCFEGREGRADLYDAMLYSLMAGGKRIRPILTLEACRMCGGSVDAALPYACAVEMVHTYSLIHDDLPCMDDDDLRRGKPTNHKVYGEALATLAGDGLLTAAFETMAEANTGIPNDRVVAAIACLGRAAGARGMVGGQALDIAGEGRALSLNDLKEIHALKTGAMISAAAEMGCLLAGGSTGQREALRNYAEKLGLAFQIRDDMLDVAGSPEEVGKPVGSDMANEKITFVSLKGLDHCRGLVHQLTDEAVESLNPFRDTEFLVTLARQMEDRRK